MSDNAAFILFIAAIIAGASAVIFGMSNCERESKAKYYEAVKACIEKDVSPTECAKIFSP